MSTTQLFVEHLIAGALTLFGIVLIIFAIGGIDANLMEKLLKYEGLLTVVGVSAMYPLGIFTDNFADFLLKKSNNKLRAKHELAKDGITIAKLLVKLQDENVSKYFNYTRMRIRISRSAIFNFSFVTISLIIFFLVRGNEFSSLNKWTAIIISLVFGGMLTFYAYWNWKNIANNYHRMTARIWRETIGENK